ncbi:SepD [Salmonella enterica]
MNDKSKQCDHKTDWLTALDFVKGIQGSSTHLKFLIYEKNSFLHDFGSYWVLYIELNGDFSLVAPDVFIRLCSILAAGKEYRQTGIFQSSKKWYLCQMYSKNNHHRANISLVIIQHTLSTLIDKQFDKSNEGRLTTVQVNEDNIFSKIGKTV